MLESQNITENNEIIKLIESGVFKNEYLIYCRKSTDDTDNQKNSIKYQKAINTRFAFDEGIRIAKLTMTGFCTDGIISERHSAFKQEELMEIKDGKFILKIERPKFQKVAEYLALKYFKGVIFLCWDRASRNDTDGLIIKRLTKENVDIRFSLTKYEKTSSGILHQDIDGMFAKHHSEVTSEKVKLNQRNLRDSGICTHKAPVGYQNLGEMENKPIDPIRAPIVKEIFKKYSEGGWSLHSLAKWANEQGFTMPPTRRRRTEEEILAEEEDDVRLEIEAISKPVGYKQVGRILGNRAYTGKMQKTKEEWIPCLSYVALISDELFEKVQKVLRSKTVSIQYADVLPNPYRKLIRCAFCNRAYTPTPKKGNDYLNSKCVEGCENIDKNFPAKIIEDAVGNLIKKLSFTEAEIEEIDARSQTDIVLLNQKRDKEFGQIERRKKTIREDIKYIDENKLTLLKSGVYTPESFLEEHSKKTNELVLLSSQEQISDEAMHKVIKDVVLLSELLKEAYVIYENAFPMEKEEIMRKIFSELSYSQNGFNYKVKLGFEPLKSRFETLCDPTGYSMERGSFRGVESANDRKNKWKPAWCVSNSKRKSIFFNKLAINYS